MPGRAHVGAIQVLDELARQLGPQLVIGEDEMKEGIGGLVNLTLLLLWNLLAEGAVVDRAQSRQSERGQFRVQPRPDPPEVLEASLHQTHQPGKHGFDLRLVSVPDVQVEAPLDLLHGAEREELEAVAQSDLGDQEIQLGDSQGFNRCARICSRNQGIDTLFGTRGWRGLFASEA